MLYTFDSDCVVQCMYVLQLEQCAASQHYVHFIQACCIMREELKLNEL